MRNTHPTVPVDEAMRRIRLDHELLLAQIDVLSAPELLAEFRVAAGPLGDFCDSLHDLVAHVLMWDEINLAVVTEAAAGRVHWSLDPSWETDDAGRRLNQAGVAAGRHLPTASLRHRLLVVRDAVLDELGRCDEQGWVEAGPTAMLTEGIGALAERVWTVPGQPAFWHAALHLQQLTGDVDTAPRALPQR